MKAEFSLKHVLRLTDNIGILEHCDITTPNPKEGYAVDDNARALIISRQVDGLRSLSSVYLNFILWAKDVKGFHQDMNADLTWKDDAGVHEGFGRAMVALAPTDHFDQLAHLILTVTYPRVIAQLVMALSERNLPAEKNELLLLSNKLVDLYNQNADSSWKWFENILTYENARLPQAIFTAYAVTQNPEYLKIGKESLDFLIKESYDNQKDCFSFIGHLGWYPKGGAKSVFGQQPVEAGGMVEVCALAYKITQDKKYLDFANKAFEWYGGRNIDGINLIDTESGGIKDGLEPNGVNPNEGAESVLSYILACLALK